MFSLNINCNKEKRRKIVYFTEPREPYVNIEILHHLVKCLDKYGHKLYIKHQPKDNMVDYEELYGQVEEIPDLSDAIVGNICIARKSTVLLKGIYNDALCAAIIINEKDRRILTLKM